MKFWLFQTDGLKKENNPYDQYRTEKTKIIIGIPFLAANWQNSR